jgi:hypothetical protein
MFAISVLIAVLMFVWGIILLYLKLRYGVDKVGCAAGGGVVDVTTMHQQHISRNWRRDRILRNWRVQSVFMMASMALPVLSFLLANRGLDPVLASLLEVHEISNQVDSLAYIGIQTARRTTGLHQELKQTIEMDLLSFCPNYGETSRWADEIGLASIKETMASGLEDADKFAQSFSGKAMDALIQVTEITEATEDAVDLVARNDWIVRLFLVALNIINSFFLFGVFLSKNNVDYVAFQAMASYLLLPLFSLVTIGSVAASCGFAMAAIANADFCSGGPNPGSPIGTFQDVAVGLGYKESSQVYQSLQYYASVRLFRAGFCFGSILLSTKLSLSFRIALPKTRFRSLQTWTLASLLLPSPYESFSVPSMQSTGLI